MGTEASIAKRVFWKAISAPSSWIPVVAGGVLVASTSGLMFWVGAGAVAAGVASAAWKMTGGRKQTTQEVVSEIKKERNRDHYEHLRQLQRRLRRDKDPLTGKMLRQLRETHKRMDKIGIQTGFTSPSWKADIREKVLGLYDSSVKSLESSFEIWTKAQQVSSEETRATLLESRSRILGEVVSSVEHLEKTLDQLQVSEVKTEVPEENLAELRTELDRGIEVARRVEERINELDEKIRVATKSPVD